MATLPALLTAEEFAKMTFPEDGVKRELKDGLVIEMGHARFGHELVKSKANRILDEWASRTDAGIVLSETEYLVSEHVSYMPDVSFLTKERASAMDPNRFAQGAPDLAVEVVSSESAKYLEEKVEDYLANGSRGVWVLYPEQRVIRLHDRSGSSRLLRETDWVEDPDLLPGFRAPVKKFFEGLSVKAAVK
jgi:Uma2 family endonuclease